MRIFRRLDPLPPAARGAVIAIGNFDGLHRGHCAVLAEGARLAHSLGAPLAVMTFTPHPREFFQPQLRPLSIYPLHEKIRLLREAGVEILFLLPFNEQLAGLSADAFASGLLGGTLGARHIVTGEHFAFGRGRSGNGDFLRERSQALGFGYTPLPDLTDEEGIALSSSRIRALLKEGNIAKAGTLLGSPYTIQGRVRRGDARGRTLGFPTANLALTNIFLPATGVYAVRVTLPDGSERGGVANLGFRPTFAGTGAPLLETHCFGETGDLYGKRLTVQPLLRLRGEKKFAGAEELRAQIAQDAEAARALTGV